MKNVPKKKTNHKMVKKDKKQTIILLRNKFSVLEIERKIEINFKNKDLLIQAFVHSSFLNENKNFYLPDNERLGFLGDAVIGLIVAEYLYKKYPDMAKGGLTSWRKSLVNNQVLGSQIQKIGLRKFIRSSEGERRKAINESTKILSDVFEALTGAIYLDQGYAVSKKFINNYLLKELSEVIGHDDSE